ncbi:MAG: SufE family protein [Acidobacteriota bacterium]
MSELSQTVTAELPEKLRDTLDLFSMMERADRIQVLIDTAERFRSVSAEVAEKPYGEEHRVPACESEAFVWAVRQPDNTLKFHFAVENPQGISAMAMAVILDDTLSGAPLEQVARVPGDIIYGLFGRELSMGKSMGLMGMVSMVQNFAKLAGC